MKILKQKILISFLLLLGFHVGVSQENQKLPALDKRVTDLTSTLNSAEILRLENKLADFEKEKGSQVVVLIIPTTAPEAIEQYGIRLAEKWKIGRAKVEDGVILIIAKEDRELRIEVGYGLEGAIPDIYAKRIIENIIVPNFRQGNFYEGIYEGTNAIFGLINKEELPQVTSASTSSNSTENTGSSILIIFLILAGFVIKTVVKNKKIKGIIIVIAALFIAWLSSSIILGVIGFVFTAIFMFSSGGSAGGGRYYGGGGSFGGGGGFSGGGFSGGGGGFGGGGASGGW